MSLKAYSNDVETEPNHLFFFLRHIVEVLQSGLLPKFVHAATPFAD